MKTQSSKAHAESNALFLRYQNGDTNALAELYNRWHHYIVKRIRNTNAFSCRLDIDEVASDVWIRVQEVALKWDIDRSSWFKFLDYMTGKVIHDTIKRRNAYKRRPDHEAFRVNIDSDENETDFIEQLASDEPPPIDEIIYNERVEALKRAIEVCQFSRHVRRILELRLQGLSNIDIQAKLGLKSRSQVTAVVHHAIKELRATINPKTLEIQPPPKTQRAKCDQLAMLGIQLAELCRKQEYKPLKLAKDLQMSPDVLMTFFTGERKPHAPVLQRLASVLGETVYAIYAPPLTNYPYAEQGQQIWYARVRQGYGIQKLARQIQLSYPSGIRQYEVGSSRPTQPRLTRMAETLYAPQLLEIY